MQERENALREWLSTQLCDKVFTLSPLAGDASFRRYFRILHKTDSYVVMDAPPIKEHIKPFIDINRMLSTIGIHTPKIHAVEQMQGFILLEDLGDNLLLNALSPQQEDTLYKAALQTLIHIQQCPISSDLPAFDTRHMEQELGLFQTWFLDAYLGLQLTAAEKDCLKAGFRWLISEINAQPTTFIHRDYHSRNLIVVTNNASPDIGVIDFQDAMLGPFTYDLVSLLKDCYIRQPREQLLAWIGFFYDQMPNQHGWSLADFIRGFDLCGLQRHLKVLGIFCRLNLRDKKPAYLKDLPLTFTYVMECLRDVKELQSFNCIMQQTVQPLFMKTLNVSNTEQFVS